MRIRNLRVAGWRNLAPLQLAFDPGVGLHVLWGDNGQGKTNVIEALHYLATFRSFRTTRALDLVQRGAGQMGQIANDGRQRAQIAVDVESRDLVRSIEVQLTVRDPLPSDTAGDPLSTDGLDDRGGERRTVGRSITLDGKPVRGVAGAYGVLGVVLFVPEDLLLIRAVPAARRRFVDMAIAGVEPGYFAEAAAFQKILRSRNAVLRAGRSSVSVTLLDTYDEQLARAGARVVMRRRALVAALGRDVRRIFGALHADLPVDLSYVSDRSVMVAADEGEVNVALLAGLQKKRAVDERRGHTTFGPQTDDVDIHLDGRPAREHASQGQMRSLILAMKFGELAHIEARRGETPVLLLDDVPSELDPTRRRFLFETLAALSCQTVVSVADPNVIPAVPTRADFNVRGGRLTAAPVFPLQTGR